MMVGQNKVLACGFCNSRDKGSALTSRQGSESAHGRGDHRAITAEEKMHARHLVCGSLAELNFSDSNLDRSHLAFGGSAQGAAEFSGWVDRGSLC